MFAAMGLLCRKEPMQTSLSRKIIMSTALTLLGVAVLVLAEVAAVLQWGPEMLLTKSLTENARQVADGMSFDSSGNLIRIKLRPGMEGIKEELNSAAFIEFSNT